MSFMSVHSGISFHFSILSSQYLTAGCVKSKATQSQVVFRIADTSVFGKDGTEFEDGYL